MTVTQLQWSTSPERIEGDPAATVQVARADWETHGAVFRRVDDGDGERPWLATGVVAQDHGRQGGYPFSVLDYDEPTTFIAVPDADAAESSIHVVLAGLLDLKILVSPDVILDVPDPEAPLPLPLDVRVSALEQTIARREEEKRRQPRRTVFGLLFRGGRRFQRFPARVVDISESGVLVKGLSDLPLGAEVSFTLEGGDARAAGSGRVARHAGTLTGIDVREWIEPTDALKQIIAGQPHESSFLHLTDRR
jgi:hypothetical protein